MRNRLQDKTLAKQARKIRRKAKMDLTVAQELINSALQELDKVRKEGYSLVEDLLATIKKLSATETDLAAATEEVSVTRADLAVATEELSVMAADFAATITKLLQTKETRRLEERDTEAFPPLDEGLNKETLCQYAGQISDIAREANRKVAAAKRTLIYLKRRVAESSPGNKSFDEDPSQARMVPASLPATYSPWRLMKPWMTPGSDDGKVEDILEPLSFSRVTADLLAATIARRWDDHVLRYLSNMAEILSNLPAIEMAVPSVIARALARAVLGLDVASFRPRGGDDLDPTNSEALTGVLGVIQVLAMMRRWPDIVQETVILEAFDHARELCPAILVDCVSLDGDLTQACLANPHSALVEDVWQFRYAFVANKS